ncbi:hypothetical protein LPB138_05115 [Urechidicola croceus]|uniref:Glycosyltransferase family 1 protein n=1 Tax=Urechidicola croceus TaxID=1850246 RepID=A0A1D8PBQ1_9FLAO|nr:hypothetical protein LPB138_05115 [Urechidicola croceus]
MQEKKKFFIVTTVPKSFVFFKGQIQVLKKAFDVEFVSSPESRLKKYSELEQVVAHPIEMEREIAVFKDIKSLMQLIKLFRKKKPQVVHGNTPKGGLLSMIASWVARVPVRIYVVHGLRYQGAKGMKRSLLINMERLACRFATHVFTVSFGVKQILKEDKITSKEINIIWNGSVNGINTEHFSPKAVDVVELKEKIGLNDSHLVFGFVGRLVKDKGVNELISAFSKINKKYSHTKLLLVGNYEEADPVSSFTKEEITSNDDIIFSGSQSDVRPYLKMMNIFTFPSYREGFGISLMEAAAMNVPAISSNITGCNEIIKDGFNGKLIKSKSEKELYNTMEEFILNPDLVKQMASVSRKYVVDKYDQKELWNKALETYQKIVLNV